MNEATRKELEALREENARIKAEYTALRSAYLKLHEAALEVSATVLQPGVCKPTWRGESGEARMIVSTRVLDRLDAVLDGGIAPTSGRAPEKEG